MSFNKDKTSGRARQRTSWPVGNVLLLALLGVLTAQEALAQPDTNTVFVSAFSTLPDNPSLVSGAIPAVDAGLDLWSAESIEIDASGLGCFAGGRCRFPNQQRLLAEFVDGNGDTIFIDPADYPRTPQDLLLCERDPNVSCLSTPAFYVIAPSVPVPPGADASTVFNSGPLPVPEGARALLFGFSDSTYIDNEDGYTVTTIITGFRDSDGDGVPDDVDNCPADVNPGQEDHDQDGEGDLCDLDDLVEISIADNIPAAEAETVVVAVEFFNAGEAVAAVAFSVDFDHLSLDFDPTDTSPADGIPDAITVNVPGDFAVSVATDLADRDGEIDVTLVDLAPPLAMLPSGPILFISLIASSTPPLSSTVIAPVDFSLDPSPSFSNDVAQDLFGTSTNGSVEIYPGPRGDCNSSGALSVADLVAHGLEIFDDDGMFWVDVVSSTFVGSPVGCDANADTFVDAGDFSCTMLLIFGGTCASSPASSLPGPGDLVKTSLRPPRAPLLIIAGDRRLAAGATTWVPVRLKRGQGLSSLVFSLDLDPGRLRFDATDRDGDGVPDAVRFPAGSPMLTRVRFDAGDPGGELDVALAESVGSTFDDGVLLEIAVTAVRGGRVAKGLRFSSAPTASFGNAAGESVPGQAVVRQTGG